MKNEGALRMRFSGMAESIGRCVITSCKPGPEYRIPVGAGPGYRTRRKETRSTHRRDEFRRAIPRRVARQHCPPPLHRHHQLKTIAASNGIIYHRTVPSLLTVCLTHRDNPRTHLYQLSDKHLSIRFETRKRIEESCDRILILRLGRSVSSRTGEQFGNTLLGHPVTIRQKHLL